MFAVLPYDQYLALAGQHDDSDVYIPHEVIGLCIEKGMSLLAAWRTHKGLSQRELAERMGITQAAVAKMERLDAKLQKRALEKSATALGLAVASWRSEFVLNFSAIEQ